MVSNRLPHTILFLTLLFSCACNAQVHKIYVDASKHTNVSKALFHSMKEALLYAEKHDSEDTLWTEIYIQPSVYWLDDPDEPTIRRPLAGDNTPYALSLYINKVRMIGMGGNAEDVVLAVNRGQTQGADGNFTMLNITGNDIEATGITFGNYCNVDLVYPKNPKQNRPRRKDAIVQAQIAICKGTGYHFRNCRFISRLNLCPFVGSDDATFDNCYFECTDDALHGNATYRKCRFTLFSSKPFYSTYGKGARLFDCDIHCKTMGTQYLTKVSGPVEIRDCRWTSDDPSLSVQWTKRPDPRNLCIMTGCTLNGKPLSVPTPTGPLSRSLPAVPVAVQTAIAPGQWTMDCHKPLDTMEYPWQADNSRSSWGYAEGVDGAEGSWGLVQIQKGARLMLTPKEGIEPLQDQTCTVVLDPCKGPGQGFGSATGQYLDICIKFNTSSLTGYGIRFIRTPEYDHAVECYLVEYAEGKVTAITTPQRCDLFKATCTVVLTAKGTELRATVSHGDQQQCLSAAMPHPNTFAGFHLQHTGSTGASATVIKSIMIKP